MNMKKVWWINIKFERTTEITTEQIQASKELPQSEQILWVINNPEKKITENYYKIFIS